MSTEPDFEKLDELVVREENDVQHQSLINRQSAADRLDTELTLKSDLLNEISRRRQARQRYADLATQIANLARVNDAALADAQTHLRSVMSSIAQLEMEEFR